MKFSHFLKEDYDNKLINLIKKNKKIDREIYLKDDSIYIKKDDSLVLKDISSKSIEQIEQHIIDFIDKNYYEEFDLNNHLNMLTYTDVRNQEIDHLLLKSKTYTNKPLLCLVHNHKKGKYIVGYAGNFDKIISKLGLPKEEYSYNVLYGKFDAIKSKTIDGITGYVISPDYEIRRADGVTPLIVLGKQYIAKHIRRKI